MIYLGDDHHGGGIVMRPRDEGITDVDQAVFTDQPFDLQLDRPLRFLSAKEIGLIDEFLAAIEGEGELKLVVHKGRLRFVTRTKEDEVTGVEE